MPVVDSIADLNERLAAHDTTDDRRRIGNRTCTVGTDFAFEQPLLHRLPDEPFETGITVTPRVEPLDSWLRLHGRRAQSAGTARTYVSTTVVPG